MQAIRSYVVSPQGRARLWIAVLMVFMPSLMFYFFLINPPANMKWHISGLPKVATQIALAAMYSTAIAVGLRATAFVRVVNLNISDRTVTRFTRVLGRAVRREPWKFCEFKSVELSHKPAGEDTEVHQSDIGFKHRSGKIVWLRSFHSENASLSPEALKFVSELEQITGLSRKGIEKLCIKKFQHCGF